MHARTSFIKGLCLTVLALFLASVALPPAAQATESVTQTTVKKKTATKSTRTKTTHKTTKKKTVSKQTAKTPIKTALLTPPAEPATGESPVVPVATKSRSISQMGTPPKAGAGASEVVRSFYSNLTETMKQGDSLGFEGRQQKLRASIERSFNMDAMMRMAAGPSWSSASPAQQKEMVRAFRAFSVANYANRFPRYAGEQFEVISEKSGRNANEKIVETRLTSGGDTTDLNYLMRRDGKGGWKIEDVYVNGTISEMATRRSEFGSVLRQQGVDAFLQLLNAKSQELGNS